VNVLTLLEMAATDMTVPVAVPACSRQTSTGKVLRRELLVDLLGTERAAAL
jgi:hypothetical protein